MVVVVLVVDVVVVLVVLVVTVWVVNIRFPPKSVPSLFVALTRKWYVVLGIRSETKALTAWAEVPERAL